MEKSRNLDKSKSNKKIIVLYPGGFKPLTGGHLSLIRRYVKNSEVKKIKLLIGPKQRDGIDQNTAIKIANIFLEKDSKIEVEPSTYPSPVLTAYKSVEVATPGKYTLASSSKGKDWERSKSFIDQHQPNGKYHANLPKNVEIVSLPVDVSPGIYDGRTDANNGNPISASILRNDLINLDKKNFSTNYPGESQEIIDQVWDILHKDF